MSRKANKESENVVKVSVEIPQNPLELFYSQAHEKLVSLTQTFKTKLKNK